MTERTDEDFRNAPIDERGYIDFSKRVVRGHIQGLEFDLQLPIRDRAIDEALMATKFLQISTILTEHFIRFRGVGHSVDETPTLIIDVPNHMTCFDILDVMREIRDATGFGST